MNTDKIVNTLARPAYTGAIAAVGARFLLGEDGTMVLFKQLVPGWLAIGVSVGLASYLAEFVDDFVLPKIPGNDYSGVESMVVAPVAAGLGSYAIFAAASNAPVPMLESFGVGAVAELASKYSFDYVKAQLC